MTNHEKLQENYEDSLFALLMDEFARSEGERFIEENARLALDETAAVPQDIERRCLRLIERETSKRARSKSAAGFLHFLARMALAALIAVMLFGAAYALSPAIRAGTLNLLMQIDERVASWQFVTESEDDTDAPDEFSDISIGWLPEGFAITSPAIEDSLSTTILCTDDSGRSIKVSMFFDSNSTYTMDIEDSDYYTNITIRDNPGILIQKDDVLRVIWADNIHGYIFFITSSEVDGLALIQVANSITIS